VKRKILFLEQQSWLSGAQRVLEFVLDATADTYDPIVALPGEGPFRRTLSDRGIKTLTYPLGFYRTGRKSRLEMLTFGGRSIVCALKLAGVIRREDIGLVYVNGPRCLPAGVLAARLTGRPVLFHLHLTLVRKPEILLVASLAHYVSTIVACSRRTAGDIVNADSSLAGRVHILYNPVGGEPAIATKPVGPSPTANTYAPLTLGVVGRITKPKGQRIFLNALGRLSPELKDKIRVIFVGSPSPDNVEDLIYNQRLKDCASQFNLSQKIQWAGYQTAVSVFYRAMDVLVHPSLWDAGESMPLAVLEALQHGVPVIASWAGGIPEVIHHGFNGLLVPPGNEVALSRTLEHFLRDTSLRAHLRSGAQSAFDERFSIENFKTEIHELIWKLCSTQHTRNSEAFREEPAA
jgi:glycosyltransferase involved in cell wall biosynthesis